MKAGYAVLLAVTACGGRSGSGGDGAGEAGSSGAPPACVADATVAAPASPVSGSVIGARLRAALCSGGANAYVEVTPTSQTVPSQTVLILSPATSGDPQTRFDVQVPKQAVQGDLSGLLGMTGPAPGTYPSESSCGSVTVCVTLPLPADLVCASAGACPPGCALQGPVLGPICQPITPTLCYQAQAARYCALGTAVPRGSWSLALTSLDPYAPDSGASLERFVAHGTLTAEVWNTDGSADSAQLSIVF